MADFPGAFFSLIFVFQFVFILVGLIATLVVVIAIWRAMKAHESIARSLRVIAQEMARKSTSGVS